MKSTAYFDNAATTFPKPESVYNFMDQFYRTCGVNVGRGQHRLAAEASALVNQTRDMLTALNRCPNKRVSFTPSATIALNMILQGLPLSDDSTIYISPFEHNAVTRVLHHLQSIYQLKILTLAVDRGSLAYDLDRIRHQFIEKRPSLVIVSHASNVCGVIAPIHDICSLAKKHDALTLVDMAQTCGLLDTDLGTKQIDFAVFAGHKTLFGPFGAAGFFCAEETELRPVIFGGTGSQSDEQSMPHEVPNRFEVGSPNVAALAGLNAALRWIGEAGLRQMYLTEQRNRCRLIELLRSYESIRVLAPEHGVGIISCLFPGYSSEVMGNVLNEHGVAVRAGLHCAPYAHRFLGTYPAGTVRFSVSCLTDEEDFAILAEALDYIERNG